MTMTTLLTLTAMFGSVRSNVPRVSYVSLLDVWMFTCIVFVFLVIIHFIAVISLLRYNKKRAAERVENIGIIVIPILFVAFNWIYWHLLITAWSWSINNGNIHKWYPIFWWHFGPPTYLPTYLLILRSDVINERSLTSFFSKNFSRKIDGNRILQELHIQGFRTDFWL